MREAQRAKHPSIASGMLPKIMSYSFHIIVIVVVDIALPQYNTMICANVSIAFSSFIQFTIAFKDNLKVMTGHKCIYAHKILYGR